MFIVMNHKIYKKSYDYHKQNILNSPLSGKKRTAAAAIFRSGAPL